MRDPTRHWIRPGIVLALVLAGAGCRPDRGLWLSEDAGRWDAGRPTVPAIDRCDSWNPEGGPYWAQGGAPSPHVVDGRFTGEEWSGAVRLQGMLTDVFIDYQYPYLYLLNDWRANPDGVRPGCFNLFRLTVGSTPVQLRVYPDGHVDVAVNGRPMDASGAYSLSPSPCWRKPHTIYEFRLAIPEGTVTVSACDPVGTVTIPPEVSGEVSSSCPELRDEPVTFGIVAGPVVAVSRQVPRTVRRIPAGGACDTFDGICAEGLTCRPQGTRSYCFASAARDDGLPQVPFVPPPSVDAGVDVPSAADVADDAGTDSGANPPPP